MSREATVHPSTASIVGRSDAGLWTAGPGDDLLELLLQPTDQETIQPVRR